MPAQQHFVNYFYSPGSFMAEQTSRPVDAWDVEAAKVMALTVLERHGSTPYGFCFTTRGRADDELDIKEVARSPFYYLGGKIETLAEIEARNDPKERILRTHMRCNGYDRAIVNDNSWRWTQPLQPTDIVLDFTPPSRTAAA